MNGSSDKMIEFDFRRSRLLVSRKSDRAESLAPLLCKSHSFAGFALILSIILVLSIWAITASGKAYAEVASNQRSDFPAEASLAAQAASSASQDLQATKSSEISLKGSSETAKSSDKSTKPVWTQKGDKFYCKITGKTQKGKIVAINGKSYLFAKNGAQKTGWQKVGSSYYYFKPGNKSAGYMVKDKVVNGVKLLPNGKASLNPTTRKEMTALICAQEFVEKYTKPAWSKSKKLQKSFRVLVYKYNERLWHKFSAAAGWARREALDLFLKKSGPCYAYGAGFAYIASAIGYKNCKAVSSGGHGWAEVDNKIYDPEWTKHQSIWLYGISEGATGRGLLGYGSSGRYKVAINPRTKELGAKSASSGSNKGLVNLNGSYYYYKNKKAVKNKWVKVGSSKYYFKASGRAATGLYKIKGVAYAFSDDGKLLKSKWVTSGSSKYYAKSDGKAAIGPAKVKGKWYVFSSSGKLLTGKSTRVVSVDGKRYRVTKSGRAKSGWSSSHTNYFNEKGLMLTGDCAISGKLYAFSSSGNYDAARTSKLQAACVLEKDVSALLALLGDPSKTYYSTSCNQVKGEDGKYMDGDDGILEYPNFTMYTFRGTDKVVRFMGVEAK